MAYIRTMNTVLNIRYKVGETPAQDHILFSDGGSTSLKTFVTILARLTASLAEFPITNADTVAALTILHRLGLEYSADTLTDLKELAYKLQLPADSPRARRYCVRCGSEIWGRESLLTGIGGGCRKQQVANKKYLKGVAK